MDMKWRSVYLCLTLHVYIIVNNLLKKEERNIDANISDPEDSAEYQGQT